MAWTINYTETAKSKLSKLDRQTARRILAYMDVRIATLDDPRITGKALKGDFGGLWRYRVGDYHMVCDIQDNTLQVLVVKAGNRKDIYSS